MIEPIPRKIKELLKNEGILCGVSGYYTHDCKNLLHFTVHNKNGNVVCVCIYDTFWKLKK